MIRVTRLYQGLAVLALGVMSSMIEARPILAEAEPGHFCMVCSSICGDSEALCGSFPGCATGYTICERDNCTGNNGHTYAFTTYCANPV